MKRKSQSNIPMPRGYSWAFSSRNLPRDGRGKFVLFKGAVLADNSTGLTIFPGDDVCVHVVKQMNRRKIGGFRIGGLLRGIVDPELPIPVEPDDKFWLIPRDCLQ